MTLSDKLEILRSTEDKAFLALRELVNLDALADTLIKILRVRDIAERIRYDGEGVFDEELAEMAGETAAEPIPTPQPEAPAEVTETAAEEPASEAPAEVPAAVGMDKKEVRRQLAAISRDRNIDIAPLMAQMGYSKFGDIPAERYGELLKLAEEA